MSVQWHIGIDGEQVGPLGPDEITSRFRRGEVTVNTLVWRAGLAAWVTFGQSELYAALEVAPVLPIRALEKPSTERSMAEFPGIPYGGFWVRVCAHLLDSSLLMSISLGLLAMLHLALSGVMNERGFAPNEIDRILRNAARVFDLLAGAFYFGFVQAVLSGTPGKRLLGLKLVNSSFGRVSVGQVLGRWFAIVISVLPFGLGIFWVGIDARKRGWHDMIAGTLVIAKDYEHITDVVQSSVALQAEDLKISA